MLRTSPIMRKKVAPTSLPSTGKGPYLAHAHGGDPRFPTSRSKHCLLALYELEVVELISLAKLPNLQIPVPSIGSITMRWHNYRSEILRDTRSDILQLQIHGSSECHCIPRKNMTSVAAFDDLSLTQVEDSWLLGLLGWQAKAAPDLGFEQRTPRVMKKT